MGAGRRRDRVLEFVMDAGRRRDGAPEFRGRKEKENIFFDFNTRDDRPTPPTRQQRREAAVEAGAGTEGTTSLGSSTISRRRRRPGSTLVGGLASTATPTLLG